MMDFYFLWLPEPKLPEKQKAYLGRFATQSRRDGGQSVPKEGLENAPSRFIPKTPCHSLVRQHREALERGREPTAPHPALPQGVFSSPQVLHPSPPLAFRAPQAPPWKGWCPDQIWSPTPQG